MQWSLKDPTMRKTLTSVLLGLTLASSSFLAHSDFRSELTKGHRAFGAGHLRAAYDSYRSAYYQANTTANKIKAIGSLAATAEKLGAHKQTQQFAEQILSLEPSNTFALNLLRRAHTPDPQNNLTEKGIYQVTTQEHSGRLVCRTEHHFNAGIATYLYNRQVFNASYVFEDPKTGETWFGIERIRNSKGVWHPISQRCYVRASQQWLAKLISETKSSDQTAKECIKKNLTQISGLIHGELDIKKRKLISSHSRSIISCIR